MDLMEIKELVYNLDWKNSKEEQEEAIEKLSKIEKKYFNLIFDKSLKATWENAVLVIDKIGTPKNEFFIPTLLWLLQDVNWPGALHAISILAKYDKNVLIPQLEPKIRVAYEREDYMWLGRLKMLVEKCMYKKTDFSEEKTYMLLEFSDF